MLENQWNVVLESTERGASPLAILILGELLFPRGAAIMECPKLRAAARITVGAGA